jgi:hypothetical protein
MEQKKEKEKSSWVPNLELGPNSIFFLPNHQTYVMIGHKSQGTIIAKKVVIDIKKPFAPKL